MATTFGRGAQNMNSTYIKPMLRKAYHKKSAYGDSTATKMNGEELKNKGNVIGDQGRVDGDCWWVPDNRTGIFYPKGHEKVIEDIPVGTGKDFRVNWFANYEDFI